MAALWNHEVRVPNVYYAAKAAPGWPVQYTLDLTAAEAAVSSMAWNEVVAQAAFPFAAAEPLHCVVRGSAMFVYSAAGGVVRAHSGWPAPAH